jgi:hypothetical protein
VVIVSEQGGKADRDLHPRWTASSGRGRDAPVANSAPRDPGRRKRRTCTPQF